MAFCQSSPSFAKGLNPKGQYQRSGRGEMFALDLPYTVIGESVINGLPRGIEKLPARPTAPLGLQDGKSTACCRRSNLVYRQPRRSQTVMTTGSLSLP